MKVAYLHPNPRPARPELDAAVRGALRLAEHFPGTMHYLYPGRRLRSFVPRWLCGVGAAQALARLDDRVDLHVLFSDQLRPYPFLSRLRKPLVYSLMTNFPATGLPAVIPRRNLARVVVAPTESDCALLRARGFRAVTIAAPGLDLSEFTRKSVPEGEEFVVLAGSAPWTRRQLRTKGVDVWLRALREDRTLRLILLWRGALEDEIADRIRRSGVQDQVELITETVDVDRVLARCHAAAVLAAHPKLVKAFPHSLLEALAAGRPVIVSRVLGMSEFVETHRCGEVVDSLSLDSLLAAVRRLRSGYELDRNGALTAPLDDFSLPEFIRAYRNLFELATGRPV